jgi:hypothetical protein
VPTDKPRVQVTVDSELAAALDEVDPSPPSRAALIRNLALRGAQLESEARERRWAIDYLMRVAKGEVDVDFDASRAAWEEREAGFE